MADLVLITRALDFIEAHLEQAITVGDMADAVSYSLYHFCRTFNQATHHTPYDYLMRRRLAEAARALLDSEARIIDIALDYQFNNPETFSRAFKRVFGLQPSRWRKEGRADSRCLMPRLSLAHLQQIAGSPSLRPGREEKPALQLAGMTIRLDRGPADLADLWALLGRELPQTEAAGRQPGYYGLLYYPPGGQAQGQLYTAAVQVREAGAIHPPLAVQTIPAQQYARFLHQGPAGDLRLTLDYIFHTWLPKSGQRLARPWLLEQYEHAGRHASEPQAGWAIYVPIE